MDAGSTQRNARAFPARDVKFRATTDTVNRKAVRWPLAWLRIASVARATAGGQPGQRDVQTGGAGALIGSGPGVP